jgi:hypothetical protein
MRSSDRSRREDPTVRSDGSERERRSPLVRHIVLVLVLERVG